MSTLGRLWRHFIGIELSAAQKDLHDSGEWTREQIQRLKAQAADSRRKEEEALERFKRAHQSLLGDRDESKH